MKKLYYDVKRCLGCRSCEIACALAHSKTRSLFSEAKDGFLPLPRKKIYFNKGKNYPVSCRHCEEPKCLDACMSAAITFDAKRGTVVHDNEKCVGCWMCVMVCPYGATRPDVKAKLPVRCDTCPDDKEPACVKGCPTKAVIWQEAAKR